jgi:hypothetical protein
MTLSQVELVGRVPVAEIGAAATGALPVLVPVQLSRTGCRSRSWRTRLVARAAAG